VQEGEPPLGALGVFGQRRLVDLVTPEQQPAAVLVAAGHPGGVEPGHVERLTTDVEGPLPPGQRLRLAEPLLAELQVGGVGLEQQLALALVGKHLGDLRLIVAAQETIMNGLRREIHGGPIDIVVAGDE
jgi:hypothetical protein